MGSNPTSSIESSVRCPKTETENLILGKQPQANDPKYEMRDHLYNRKYQQLQKIDPTLLCRFITAANKEYIENLKTNNPNIEKNIIHKPFWLNELRTTIHSFLSNKEKQQKEDKDKLLMLI